MGYIDSNTMIEFKDKMVKKIKDKSDHHVLCELNRKLDPSLKYENALFSKIKSYEEGARYTFAIGQGYQYGEGDGQGKTHYLKLKNGNGFPTAFNDYLHQRKHYLDYELDTTKNYPRISDLLKFLFGDNWETLLSSTNFLSRSWVDEHIYYKLAEYSNPPKIFGLNIDIHNFTDYYNTFISSLEHQNIRNWFVRRNATGSHGEEVTCFNGRLYIVKNQFTREKGTKFCEEVYGFLDLAISINNVYNYPDADGSSVSITIFIRTIFK